MLNKTLVNGVFVAFHFSGDSCADRVEFMEISDMPANPFSSDAQSGKIAVVSGASSGIGRATATLMRATGWTVYGVARRADHLNDLAKQTGVIPCPLDITDADAVQQRTEKILQETGGSHERSSEYLRWGSWRRYRGRCKSCRLANHV